MSVLWTTEELPGHAFDPEPDDEDDGPWCHWPDLHGQGLTLIQLHTLTDIPLAGSYL